MPVAVSYPGVYVEEIPSGVRTIAGVATSITAFVGRTVRGPVNEATVINSFGDYERRFGGLANDSTVSFAVRDYFLNGGAQAIVVRLFSPTFVDEPARQAALAAATAQAQTAADAVAAAATAEAGGAAPTADSVATAARGVVAAASAPGAAAAAAADAVADAAEAAAALAGADAAAVQAAATAAVAGAVSAAAAAQAPVTRARMTIGGITLVAANEGRWGNSLRARIDHDVSGPGAADLFNLAIRDGVTGEVELVRNVSIVANHVRRVDNVLRKESKLLRVEGALPGARPAPSTAPAPGGDPWAAANSTGIGTPASDGLALTATHYLGSEAAKTGIFALEQADLFNLLCLPPMAPATDVPDNVWSAADSYCLRKRALLIVDAPSGWTDVAGAVAGITAVGATSRNAAIYFPRLRQPNPLRDGQIETFAPCGAVAGLIARTDGARGVWKAPAGLEAALVGVPEFSVPLTDAENGQLNPLGINCLRNITPAGRIVWGARTRQGDDRLASEWKYVPVRRLALYIEESLYRGTQWVVFEPNDEPLWAQIRLNVGAFMHTLFRQGAFQGSTPSAAYLVKCDRETTTPDDVNRGIVNIVVGFAPLKPAEFVIIKLQQLAGQTQA
jgi:phage tail sheath protein FI